MSPPSHRDQFLARVLANVPLCREHFRLVLGVPSFPQTQPGQFIQIACSSACAADAPSLANVDDDDDDDDVPEIEWYPGQRVEVHDDDLGHPVALLRRPFSLAGRRDTDEGVEL